MGPDTIYGTSQGPDSAISFWEKFKQNTQWEIVLNVWEKENSYILSQCDQWYHFHYMCTQNKNPNKTHHTLVCLVNFLHIFSWSCNFVEFICFVWSISFSLIFTLNIVSYEEFVFFASVSMKRVCLGVFISLAWQWWWRRSAINTHYTRPPTITCPNLHSLKKNMTICDHFLWNMTICDNFLWHMTICDIKRW